jgi:hypothetical protein
MLNCTVPKGIRRLADATKDLFAGRLGSYCNLCAIFALFLFNYKTMSALARGCPWSHSVSDLSRAVKDFNGNRFMRRMRSSILRKYGGKSLDAKDFCFAVDDTDNPKYGKGIYRQGKWRGSKGKYQGQKVLVIVLVDIKRRFAIPLSFAFVAKKDDPEYKSGLDLALELFEGILESKFPKLNVTADSWFDSTEFISGLKKLGLTYIGEIKGNRLVKGNPGKNVCWLHLPKFFIGRVRSRLRCRLESKAIKSGTKRAKCGSEAILYIKKLGQPLKCLAVYNKMNSKNAFAYYVSTDLSMSGAQLWEFSRARWKIECLFYDVKQNLSFGRLPCAGKEGADLAVCMPFMIYTSLRLDPPSTWGLDKAESIGTMVKKIREVELGKSIDLIARSPGHGMVSRLAARRRLQNVSKKPVNRLAERKNGYKTQAA